MEIGANVITVNGVEYVQRDAVIVEILECTGKSRLSIKNVKIWEQ